MNHRVLPPSRRSFIKTFMVGSAYSVLNGMPWKARFVGEVRADPSMPGSLPVRISQYPALQSEGGSIRLTFNAISGTTALGPYYPILVNRGPNDTFYVLTTYCQHNGCVVPTYNTSEGAIVCPCHGSRYDIDGSVLQGPTISGLPNYDFTYDGVDLLCVNYPYVNLHPESLKVTRVGGNDARLQLSFETVEAAPYQVLYRTKFTDTPQPVLFSLTSGGPLNTTQFNGDGRVNSVYVNATATAGFFTVSLMITQV